LITTAFDIHFEIYTFYMVPL